MNVTALGQCYLRCRAEQAESKLNLLTHSSTIISLSAFWHSQQSQLSPAQPSSTAACTLTNDPHNRAHTAAKTWDNCSNIGGYKGVYNISYRYTPVSKNSPKKHDQTDAQTRNKCLVVKT